MRLFAVVAALVAIAACSPTDGVPDPNDVSWGDYAPGLRAQIDDARQQGDCAALDAFFDAARHADLKKYAERSMRYAECYG